LSLEIFAGLHGFNREKKTDNKKPGSFNSQSKQYESNSKINSSNNDKTTKGRRMSESPASSEGGRAAKRISSVGRDSVGCPPKEFSDNAKIAKVEYSIHNSANRVEKRGERFFTGVINAHSHPWKLQIYRRGCTTSKTGT
jgi:hypothetical protein